MNRTLYVNVKQLLAEGLEPPAPTILPISDQLCLFYADAFNLVYGDTESGKTWLCLAAVVSTLNDGGRASIVDLDHNGAAALVDKLINLGVDIEILEDPTSFRLYEPIDQLELKEVVQDQSAFKPDIVILDSLGEILPLFRANSNSADDFLTVHAEVIKPLERHGACVVVIDHLAKNADSRAQGPGGTGAKLRPVNGIALLVTVDRQFTPGSGGSSKLTLRKDRNGVVRSHYSTSKEPFLGTFELLAQNDSESLGYTFRCDQVVPVDTHAGQRLENDIERLRIQFGEQKPTVRTAREFLNCSQQRARAACDGFDEYSNEEAAA